MTAIANGTVWYNASLFIPSHDTEGWDNVVLVCIPNICFTMANMVWIHTVVILSLNERLLPVLHNPPDCSSLWGKPVETVLMLVLTGMKRQVIRVVWTHVKLWHIKLLAQFICEVNRETSTACEQTCYNLSCLRKTLYEHAVWPLYICSSRYTY